METVQILKPSNESIKALAEKLKIDIDIVDRINEQTGEISYTDLELTGSRSIFEVSITLYDDTFEIKLIINEKQNYSTKHVNDYAEAMFSLKQFLDFLNISYHMNK